MKIISIFFISGLIFFLTGCFEHPYSPLFEDGQMTNLIDGTYTGKVNMDADKATLTITIQDGKIVDVSDVDIFAFAWRKEATETNLPSQLIEKQSVTGLDAVTGATGSTHAFQAAVTEALLQAIPDNIE